MHNKTRKDMMLMLTTRLYRLLTIEIMVSVVIGFVAGVNVNSLI